MAYNKVKKPSFKLKIDIEGISQMYKSYLNVCEGTEE